MPDDTKASIDGHVVDEIVDYLTATPPRSFFLFAGAGSGKTRTLTEVLKRLTGMEPKHEQGRAFATALRRRGRRMAVITYTKAATEELSRRVESNPLVDISTIHTFCWRLIEGFDNDLRECVRHSLRQKLETERSKPPKRASTSGTLPERHARWERKCSRMERDIGGLDDIRLFTYSPDSERLGPGALSHSDVLAFTATLLANKPNLRRLVADRYPIILVDESQDTMKDVLQALLDLESQTSLTLGLVGDHRQRIYSSGDSGLVTNIPDTWERPRLSLNWRCPKRVVELINHVWTASLDGRTERPLGGEQTAAKPDLGVARIFLGPADIDEAAKHEAERAWMGAMGRVTDDPGWNNEAEVKVLLLEHQLSANRAGFGDLYRALKVHDKDSTSRVTRPDARGVGQPHEVPPLQLLANVLHPLYDAIGRSGEIDNWVELDILRQHSPLLDRRRLEDLNGEKQRAAFAEARTGSRALGELWNTADPTLRDLLEVVREHGLFDLAPQLCDALEWLPDGAEGTTPEEKLAQVLAQPWSTYLAYRAYASAKTPHDTHQGVKGLEFERVMVVMDDTAAGGFLFSYERLFGGVGLSRTYPKSVEDGKETSIDRTLRLLYVTCSRASKSLALVIWTKSPDAVRDALLTRRWFNEEEITTLGS